MNRLFVKLRFTRFLLEGLVVILIATAPAAPCSQRDTSNPVRLFRLDGTFAEELPLNIESTNKSQNSWFRLTEARLEAENGGFLTRLRTLLTIANEDPSRRITEVEWRLDVFDASLRSASARVVQTDKKNIYSGETAVASARLGAVLPDRMIVLLQVIRVAFADGQVWSAQEECSLGEDLRTVICKPNNRGPK